MSERVIPDDTPTGRTDHMSPITWLDAVRAALEAAAPAIAAAALRRAIDAADEAFAQEDIAMTQWGNGYIDGQGAALDSIRNYADEMEADRG